MEEDLIVSLTRQVKEEVVENYLNERKLIHLQLEEFRGEAEQTRELAREAGQQLSRMAQLTIHPQPLRNFLEKTGVSLNSFWEEFLHQKPGRDMRSIKVRSLTDRGKYRKTLLEAYQRLLEKMKNYEKNYEELRSHCNAINLNIKNFQKNYDLLSIMQFLRSLDTQALERKHFLGENFTAEEMASLDTKLQINTLDFQKMDVPPPLPLPPLPSVEQRLAELAAETFRKHEREVRDLMLHGKT